MINIFLVSVLIVLVFALIVCLLMLGYFSYQLKRNDAVYKIRKNWIETRDPRHELYSYSYMFDPNKINLFGLKYPRDNHFR